MTKKLFKFNYDFYKAEVVFEVDLEIFTLEMAQETLDFFSWDYDEDADPIDEAMKKYALEVLRYSSGYQSVYSLRKEFNQEGFGTIDGKIGIFLMDFEGFSFSQGDLEMEVLDV